MFNTVFLFIFILSIAVIIVVIIRKFPALAAIDAGSIPKEKQEKVKKEIILSRFKRRVERTLSKILPLWRPFVVILRGKIKGLYEKILEIEKKYQEKKKITGTISEEEKIKNLFFEAEELIKGGKEGEAEKKYLEIISLDYKNLNSFQGLAELYLKQKEFHQAKETLEHILKISPRYTEAIIDLANLYQTLDEPKKALTFFKQAVRLEPNNPRYLDLLCEASIIVGNNILAEETLDKLEKVNPENQKLEEFKKRIREIK